MRNELCIYTSFRRSSILNYQILKMNVNDWRNRWACNYEDDHYRTERSAVCAQSHRGICLRRPSWYFRGGEEKEGGRTFRFIPFANVPDAAFRMIGRATGARSVSGHGPSWIPGRCVGVSCRCRLPTSSLIDSRALRRCRRSRRRRRR